MQMMTHLPQLKCSRRINHCLHIWIAYNIFQGITCLKNLLIMNLQRQNLMLLRRKCQRKTKLCLHIRMTCWTMNYIKKVLIILKLWHKNPMFLQVISQFNLFIKLFINFNRMGKCFRKCCDESLKWFLWSNWSMCCKCSPLCKWIIMFSLWMDKCISWRQN